VTYLERTRTAYDLVAEDYATLLADHLGSSAWDRAQLAVLAEMVQAAGGGPVADLGCGPGRLTGHLAGLGLDVFGVDLSPAMVAEARRRNPQLRFEVGALQSLDIATGELAASLGWYSLIHTPPADQPAVLAELARVLRPEGLLLLAFQAGPDLHVHKEEGYGHPISLDVHRLDPDRVSADLVAAGFEVAATTLRAAVPPESTPQAYLLARRG